MSSAIIDNVIQLAVLFVGIFSLYLAIKKNSRQMLEELCDDVQGREKIRNDIKILELRINSLETTKKEEFAEIKQMLKELTDKFNKHLEKHGDG